MTDFVPLRPYTLTLVLLAGGTVIALLSALHVLRLGTLESMSAEGLRAFDMAAPGSLASWFAAVLLAAAAAAAWFVFTIRRHRLDDYRGRYRLWIWGSLLLLAGSLDAGGSLGGAITSIAIWLAGNPQGAGGPAWAAGFVAFPAAALLGRLAIESRRSRGTLGLLATSAGAYLAAWTATYGTGFDRSPEISGMVGASFALFGHLALTLSIACYGRSVPLEPQGNLAVARPKKKKSPKSASTRRAKKADTPAEEAAAPTKRAAEPAKPSSGSGPTVPFSGRDDESEEEDDGLSKAERRRQRKLSRRDRRAA